MTKKWRILDSQFPLKNRWISVRRDTCQLPSGRVIDDYFVLEENDVGCVFALTPDRKLILVEQYKHAIQDLCLEVPAGFFENGAGDPLEEARREFREETGYDADQFHYLGKLSQSPTRMTNYFHLFVAENAYPAGAQNLDPNEDITVRLMPLDDVLTMITSGEINSVSTVACIYRALSFLKQ